MIGHTTGWARVWEALHALPQAVACLSLFLASGLLAATSPVNSDYLITTWQVEDGLPNNSVSAITQTPDGYLWLATFGGLARFDGVRFEVFDSQNTPAIKSGKTVGLFLDRHGDLLMAPQSGGLVRYRDGQFLCLDAGWKSDMPIHFLVEDRAGVWCASLHHQNLSETNWVQFTNNEWRSVPVATTLAGRVCLQLARDSSGQVWLATDKELAFEKDGQFRRLELEPLRLEAEQPLLASPRGGLWVAANGRLRKLKDGQWTSDLGPYPWGTKFLTVQHEDREGNLWIGTFGEGLFCFPAGGGSCRHLTTADGLSHNRIRSILEDREGNLWVGTEGGGLNRLRKRVFSSVHRQQGLLDMPVWSVTTGSDGSVCWSTEFDGVYGLRGGQLWRDPPALFPAALGEERPQAPDKASAICEDRSGTIWLGLYPAGLMKKVNGRYEMVAGTGRTHPRIRVLYEDRQGGLWAGAESGLLLIRGETVRGFTTRDGLWSDSIQALAETPDGTLWVGTTGGLNRYSHGLFVRQIDQTELPRSPVGALHCDGEGVLWMGTDAGDLAWLQAGRFSPCPANPGGPTGPIIHIATDDFDGLWVAVNRGIFRASRRALRASSSHPEKPIPWLEFSRKENVSFFDTRAQPAGCKTPDGRLWFATVNGVVSVDPRRAMRNELAPPVLIETMLVDGVRSSLESFSGPAARTGPARLEIGPGHRQFEFRYTALSFVDPDRVRFKYQLEGLDPDWVDAGTRRVANYGHVPPGAYQFRVMACNNDRVWNQKGAGLAFRVQPYFWQTGWFLGLSTLLAAAAVAGSVRLVLMRRMRLRLERLRQMHAVERERTRIARDIHDDLGAGLTRISLLSSLAERALPDPQRTVEHLANVSNAVREITRSLDEVVWAVEPGNDTLDHLATYLCHYAEEFLQEASVRCRLKVPSILPAVALASDWRHDLFLAVKEALNNVAKHAGATSASLSLSFAERRLAITIEDDGRGFDAAGTARGRGLGNMRRRVEELGGRFVLESWPGRGTRVIMDLPLPGGRP